MSVKDFLVSVKDSEDYRSQLLLAANEDEYVQRVVDIAAGHGFQFTADDVQQCINEARGDNSELTEEQLETVAGGGWTDGWCINLTLATGAGSACDINVVAGPDGQGDFRHGPIGF